MTSNLLQSMGLGQVDIGAFVLVLLALFLILLILLIVTMAKLSGLKKRYERFMMGSNARSMEEEVKNLFYDIDYLKKESDQNKKEIRHIYKRLETVFQKVGLVKYDAFHQMGGKLSFALALLDEKDNGFLMNSVHSSDGSYCYIKEIHDGSSAIELSEDEQKALSQALEQKFTLRLRVSEDEQPAERRSSQSSREQVSGEHKKKKPVSRDRFEDPDLLEAEALIAGLAEDDGEYVEVTKKSRSSKKKRRNTDALYDDGNISHVSVKKATPKKKAAPEPEYDEYDD